MWTEKLGLFAFAGFTLASLMVASERRRFTEKSVADWVTDLASVLMHFLVLPSLQVAVVYGLLNALVPHWKGTLPGTFSVSLLLYVLVDYSWYWNHRLFHARTPLWSLHKTHHSPEQVDVFVTPRNALVAHFLMVYFWFLGLSTFLLADSSWFLGFAAFGVVVNFWGHTNFYLPCESWANRLLRTVIVTPREHLWHHSRENPHCNFGTVLSFWDRLHGTEHCGAERPAAFGEPAQRTVWNQLIWPFSN
jgi:sterol desaturase/sphingolipid hydroxylase (fatty acid hydroxylase superfamily)